MKISQDLFESQISFVTRLKENRVLYKDLVANHLPYVLDPSIINEVIEVSDDNAINTARMIVNKARALVGTSSGANVWASIKTAGKYGSDKVLLQY